MVCRATYVPAASIVICVPLHAGIDVVLNAHAHIPTAFLHVAIHFTPTATVFITSGLCPATARAPVAGVQPLTVHLPSS